MKVPQIYCRNSKETKLSVSFSLISKKHVFQEVIICKNEYLLFRVYYLNLNLPENKKKFIIKI